jgi:hypothetical protein
VENSSTVTEQTAYVTCPKAAAVAAAAGM